MAKKVEWTEEHDLVFRFLVLRSLQDNGLGATRAKYVHPYAADIVQEYEKLDKVELQDKMFEVYGRSLELMDKNRNERLQRPVPQ